MREWVSKGVLRSYSPCGWYLCTGRPVARRLPASRAEGTERDKGRIARIIEAIVK